MVLIVLAGVSITLLILIRSHSLLQTSREINNRVINKFGQHCKKCDKDYYVCSICGCEYEQELDARRCFEWDLILRKKHEHQYLHNHEDKD